MKLIWSCAKSAFWVVAGWFGIGAALVCCPFIAEVDGPAMYILSIATGAAVGRPLVVNGNWGNWGKPLLATGILFMVLYILF